MVDVCGLCRSSEAEKMTDKPILICRNCQKKKLDGLMDRR